jgi:hypothetical protein
MSTSRVIPIKKIAAAPAVEDAHVRLERAGFMRMMSIGEPHLSKLVGKYRALGYEVEVVLIKTAESGGQAGCNTGIDAGCTEPGESLETIYVRKRMQPTAESE